MSAQWIRTCQECLHQQSDVKPEPNKEPTEAYKNRKCEDCNSESLDFGKIING